MTEIQKAIENIVVIRIIAIYCIDILLLLKLLLYSNLKSIAHVIIKRANSKIVAMAFLLVHEGLRI
jgi:hypothetical protein